MKKATERLIDRLDQAVAAGDGDWSVQIDGGYQCAWSAMVRVTEYPNVRDATDRSIVHFQSGGDTPEDALNPALVAAIHEVAEWSGAPGPARWDES